MLLYFGDRFIHNSDITLMELSSQAKNPDSELWEMVYSEMTRLGWSAADLARQSGVSPSKLSNLKNGRSVSAKNLFLILKALKIIHNKRRGSPPTPIPVKNSTEYQELLNKYVDVLEENRELKEHSDYLERGGEAKVSKMKRPARKQ